MTKGMAAYGGGGGPCRPLNGRQAPVAPSTGDRPPFFFSRDFVANLEKKIILWACRPIGGRPGYIFEIFQNGHIFLNFFLNIKKKKSHWRMGPLIIHWATVRLGRESPLFLFPFSQDPPAIFSGQFHILQVAYA